LFDPNDVNLHSDLMFYASSLGWKTLIFVTTQNIYIATKTLMVYFMLRLLLDFA